MAIVSNTTTPTVSRIKNGVEQLDKLRWLIYGPAGAGKTTMASTIDEPDSTLWVTVDTNPATSLLAQGIAVPNLLDLQEVMYSEKKSFTQCIDIADQEIAAFAKSRGGKFSLVFDGVTMANTLIQREFINESDTQKMWGKVGGEITRLLLTLNKYPVPLVWVAHSGVESVRDEKVEAVKREAAGVTQEEKIKPDVVGRNANLFINQTDVSGFLKKVTTPKGEEKRVFFPDGGASARGKSRFEAQLDAAGEEPNLRKMIEKIKNNLKK